MITHHKLRIDSASESRIACEGRIGAPRGKPTHTALWICGSEVEGENAAAIYFYFIGSGLDLDGPILLRDAVMDAAFKLGPHVEE